MAHGWWSMALAATGLTEQRCVRCNALRPQRSTHGIQSFATDLPPWSQQVHTLLCAQCSSLLLPRTRGYCPLCGLVLGSTQSGIHRCSDCRTTPPAWDALSFYGGYDHGLKQLLTSFKFGQQIRHASLLQTLARCVAARLQADHPQFAPSIVVPVPLHPRRLVHRGFNQSTELGRAMAAHLEIPLSNTLLTRTRHTIPQSSLPRKERLHNLHNAFTVNPSLLRNHHVLVVDDIMTTGSTVREIVLTLRQAGAARVGVAILARA